jgi:hypothetical protein
MFLMFLFLLYVARSSSLSSRNSLSLPLKCLLTSRFYIVQITPIYWAWILRALQFGLIILSIFRRTMTYVASVRNNLGFVFLAFLYPLSINIHIIIYAHVKWVLCHRCMARPQVVVGGDALQVWRAAANILNKKSRTADKGWSLSLVIRHRANNSSP